MRRRVLLLCGLAGCGLGGAAGGGSDDLPISGVGPYAKFLDETGTAETDTPYVVEDARADLTDPTALPRAGGGYHIWYTRTPFPAGSGPTTIGYAAIRDLVKLPDVGPGPSLAPDQPWEAGAVREPSVITLDDGTLVMYYAGGGDDPMIGRAVSTDGTTWVKSGPLLAGEDPGALRVGHHVYLYYDRPKTMVGIYLAESDDDGKTFTTRPDPVLVPVTAPKTAFDLLEVREPDPVGGVSQAGELVIGLLYTGFSSTGHTGIGYAGSFDGVTFVRGNHDIPILEPGLIDESGPGLVLFPDHGVLFFSQQRGQVQAIAAAVAP